MSNTFSERLLSLRKERRISQKEASAYFGISQALLSHYENGIRQCSIDFVIKAASFYSVSTDYLLGVSSAKSPSEEIYTASHPGDVKLSFTTLQRAVGVLSRQSESLSDKQSTASVSEQCLYLYKLILLGISAGKIPCSWLGIDTVSQVKELVKIINALKIDTSVATDEKISLLKSDEPVPVCIQTVVNEAKKTLADLGTQMFLKMSIN